MAVFNMPKPMPTRTDRPGYGQYTKPNDSVRADRLTSSYSARPDHMSKPEMKPGAGGQFMRPPAMPQRPNPMLSQPPQQTTPIGSPWQMQAERLPPPQYTTPVGPSLQMQAAPANATRAGGGFGYSPIGGRFGGGGTEDQGRLAAALQRLFGY